MIMNYDIYPCDLNPFDGCSKHVQDCANCIGWFICEEDEENSCAERPDDVIMEQKGDVDDAF